MFLYSFNGILQTYPVTHGFNFIFNSHCYMFIRLKKGHGIRVLETRRQLFGKLVRKSDALPEQCDFCFILHLHETVSRQDWNVMMYLVNSVTES